MASLVPMVMAAGNAANYIAAPWMASHVIPGAKAAAAGYAGALTAYGAYKGMAYKRARSPSGRFTKRRKLSPPRRRKARSGGSRTVTKYHDVSTSRVRSRRPRGRKLRMIKQVQNVINRSAGLNVFMQTHYGLATATATAYSNASGYDEFQLGCAHNSSNRFNDLTNLFLSMRNVFPGGTAPPDAVLTKLYLQSMVMDVKVTNTDTDDDVWLDVYHYVYRKDCTDDSNMVVVIADSYDSTYEMDATLTFLPAIGYPGTTPFDYPLVGSYLNIIKKQRMLLQAGANTGFTIKRRVNRILNSDIISDFNSLRGLTYGIFFKFQNATVSQTPITANTYIPKPSSIQTYCTNTYHYRIIQNNYPTQGIVKTTQ